VTVTIFLWGGARDSVTTRGVLVFGPSHTPPAPLSKLGGGGDRL
jgi:hypothetical protein